MNGGSRNYIEKVCLFCPLPSCDETHRQCLYAIALEIKRKRKRRMQAAYRARNLEKYREYKRQAREKKHETLLETN